VKAPRLATAAIRSVPGRARLRAGSALLLAGALAGLPGCVEPPPSSPAVDPAVFRRAEAQRVELLEAEIERLRADLRRAEEALVLAESGLRGSYSRADAVSALAESRIEVERAARQAPWRAVEIAEARRKLDEADSQIRQDHFGAAFFFVYRAQRMADAVKEEAKLVRARPGTLFVTRPRVNLRAGPTTGASIVQVLGEGSPVFPEVQQDPWVLVRVTSGSVGWVHRSLLSERSEKSEE
jgi:hypothetical protein